MVAKRTVQLNLRLPRDSVRYLRKLAEQASIRYGKKVTVQELIRDSLAIAEAKLKAKCILPTTYDVKTGKPVATT